MIRRLLSLLILLLIPGSVAWSQYVTITGTLQSANGLTAQNYLIAFQPSQFFFIANTSVIVNSTVFCATSTDGTVVGTSNPSQPAIIAAGFTGTLPPAMYYIQYAWYDAAGHTSLPSAEQTKQLTATGQLQISPPASGMPATAVGMNVYIWNSSGGEMLAGQTVGNATFVQSVPLASSFPTPTTNSTVCKIVANDAGWPTGTSYSVTLSDPSGNTSPGYPMSWRLLGPNTTINLSNGLPLYNGLVTYPVPILASPFNHNIQSIAGPLSLSGYNLVNVGAIGVGTALPAWPVDVENGPINASGGYLVGGSGGTAGKCLGSDGTAYDVPINCLTSVTLFYQTIKAATVAQPQEPALNFSTNFALTDTATTSTNVDLASVITSGSCTNCNLTYDAFGRIRTAANGPTIPVVKGGTVAGCTTTSSSYDVCSVTVTWSGGAFVDTAYNYSCSALDTNVVGGGSSDALTVTVSSKTAADITVVIQTQRSNTASPSFVSCVGVHP